MFQRTETGRLANVTAAETDEIEIEETGLVAGTGTGRETDEEAEAMTESVLVGRRTRKVLHLAAPMPRFSWISIRQNTTGRRGD